MLLILMPVTVIDWYCGIFDTVTWWCIALLLLLFYWWCNEYWIIDDDCDILPLCGMTDWWLMTGVRYYRYCDDWYRDTWWWWCWYSWSIGRSIDDYGAWWRYSDDELLLLVMMERIDIVDYSALRYYMYWWNVFHSLIHYEWRRLILIDVMLNTWQIIVILILLCGIQLPWWLLTLLLDDDWYLLMMVMIVLMMINYKMIVFLTGYTVFLLFCYSWPDTVYCDAIVLTLLMMCCGYLMILDGILLVLFWLIVIHWSILVLKVTLFILWRREIVIYSYCCWYCVMMILIPLVDDVIDRWRLFRVFCYDDDIEYW